MKVNGQVLRETSNSVKIPFGSEYSVLLRNLHSVRALAKVSIDGQEASSGWLIANPNSSFELERFIRNDNLETGNRFKFIERTAAIEKHKGIGSDDGLVRVEFKFERVQGSRFSEFKGGITVQEIASLLEVRAKDVIAYLLRKGIMVTVGYILDATTAADVARAVENGDCPQRPYYPPPRPFPSWPPIPRWPNPYPRWSSGPTASARPRTMSASARSMRSGPSGQSRRPSNVPEMDSAREVERGALNEAGITVPGSESHQRFVAGEYFPTESHSDVIVLHLIGEVGGKPVIQAVTVKHKPQCSSCGHANKGGSQFCSRCGTALVIL